MAGVQSFGDAFVIPVNEKVVMTISLVSRAMPLNSPCTQVSTSNRLLRGVVCALRCLRM